jgi:methyl-accepting chemotaxis protein
MSFSNLRIRWKLALMVALLFAGFLGFGLTTARIFQTVSVGGPCYARIVLGKDLVADILPPPAYIIEAFLVSHEIEDTPDAAESAKLIERFAQLERDYNARREHWTSALEESPLKQALLVRAHEPAADFFRIANTKLIPLARAGKFEEAAALHTEQLVPLFKTHREAINTCVELANTFCAENEKQAAAAIASGNNLLVTIFGVTLTVCGIAAFFIARSISSPLNTTLARLREITSGDGDLTHRLPATRKDELGELAGALNAFLDNLSEMVRRLNAASNEVASAATEIAASSEEMSASITQVTRQTAEAAELAKSSEADADKGGSAVSASVKLMNAIDEAVSLSSQSVAELGSRGEEIGRIVGVISEIADQTNLLALNAAIEAARAGEHGRGFAVVADEVRKLAERTTASTEEVSRSIHAIQTETSQAVERMAAGKSQVAEGVARTSEAGKTLGKIVANAQNVALTVTSIATAANECGAGASQAADAASSLSQKAEELRELVSRFKVA